MENNKLIAYVSWGLALLAMVMSLFFSEVMKLPPCSLCWYQRIFMYPLVFIIPIGILKNDNSVFTYCLALSLMGLVFSTYHTFIYHGIIPETLKLCNSELSCKAKQFELFGFFSIPLMSTFCFLTIFILNLIGEKNAKRT